MNKTKVVLTVLAAIVCLGLYQLSTQVVSPNIEDDMVSRNPNVSSLIGINHGEEVSTRETFLTSHFLEIMNCGIILIFIGMVWLLWSDKIVDLLKGETK